MLTKSNWYHDRYLDNVKIMVEELYEFKSYKPRNYGGHIKLC